MIPPATQDHNFHLQAIFSIHGKTEALEQKFSGVEARLAKVESKLEDVISSVQAAKVTVGVFGAILSVLGALALVFLNKILDVVVNHYKPLH